MRLQVRGLLSCQAGVNGIQAARDAAKARGTLGHRDDAAAPLHGEDGTQKSPTRITYQ